jgi:type IV pilus assembly protein PilC
MPRYTYSAVSASGEKVQGDYSSPDEAGVIAMLRMGGYFPTGIKVKTRGEGKVTKSRISYKVLAGFCSQMAAMLKAGVPIAKTLEILKDQTEDKPLRKILDDVYTSVHRGNSLSEALTPYTDNFPAIFLNMVEAGEASGTLDLCLERAGVSFSRTQKLNNKVKNAMIYPAVIVTVLVGLLVVMLVFVIPAFTELYASNNAELPGYTAALLSIGDFVQNRWYIIVLAVAVIIIGVRMWLASDGGRTAFDKFKFRMPVIKKLLSKVYAARFSRSLASLTSAGVSLPEALTVTARSVINKFMEKEIYKVVDAVNRGDELSQPLERMKLLPPMIVYLTRLGEESGTMDTLLLQAADYYDEESDTTLQAIMALLEPALIVMMAVIVVPILIGVMLPMFNMYEAML